jgi:hypothetical protein
MFGYHESVLCHGPLAATQVSLLLGHWDDLVAVVEVAVALDSPDRTVLERITELDHSLVMGAAKAP